MPKLNAYSRSNNFDTLGLIDTLNAYTDQPVLQSSDVTFNSIEVATVLTSGDVVVGGDFTVNGKTTIISSDTVEIVDNIILINSEQDSPGVSLNLAGLEVERGSLTNFQLVYEESSESFKVGEVGDLQTVATREDSPLDKGVLVYNDLEKRLDSVTSLELPITFASGDNPTSSTTGSLIVSGGGGIGVTGDIYTDDTIFVKGSGYNSFIKSNGSDDMIINSGSNFIFQQATNTRVQIPSHVNLIFGSLNKRIYTNGTDLFIENSGGEMRIVTSGNVRLDNNKYIQWDNGNLIGYNGTNMILNSTGNFTVSPLLVVGLTTSSSSPTTGGMLSLGGIGISHSTDAMDEDNGGSFTTAGGLSVKKKIFSGLEITSNSGENSNHFRLFSNKLNRFSLGLDGTETGSNLGSDFVIKNYNDAGLLINNVLNINRQTGHITIPSITPSTSSTTGSLKITGGFSISNTTNAVSSINGGTFTTAGGAAIAKDLYIGQNLNISDSLFVEGITHLDQTNIDTTEGALSITGTNQVSILVDNSSSFTTTLGSLTFETQNGTLILSGEMGIDMQANSGINIEGMGDCIFTTSSGKISLVSSGVIINGGSQTVNVTSTGLVELNSGSGGTGVYSTDTINGIKIGTNLSSVPISIGHTSSEVIVNDNLTVGGDLTILGTTTSINSTIVDIADNALVVNSLPSGLSDGGYLIRRFQNPNDTLSGEVIKDTPFQTGSFQAGSSTPTTLILDSGASSVDGFYEGMWIVVTSGLGINQVRRIKTYTGSTKIAEIYGDGEIDGLNLNVAPLETDTYNIYNGSFSSIFYSESSKEFRIAYIPLNTSSGEFPNPGDYLTLHAGGLVLEQAFTTNSIVLIDATDTEAFLVRKAGDTGDVFKIDTVNSVISLENPTNVINTDINLQFKQLDTVNAARVYSEMISTVKDNVAGNLKSDLEFKVQNDIEGLTTLLKLSGNVAGNSFVDITDAADSLRILNTSPATSSSSGALRIAGGFSISNTTDAVSSSNGGTITTAGGASIAKKLFVGTDLTVDGDINAGVTTESLTVFNPNNINGTVDIINPKLISNSGEKMLSVVLRFNCTSSHIPASFELILPSDVTFNNIYDAVGYVSGFANDASPINLENAFMYCITPTNRVKVSFTSSFNTDIHTINVLLRYTV